MTKKKGRTRREKIVNEKGAVECREISGAI